MTDMEKQELELSRMIDNEGKSKLKSIGIKKNKFKNSLEDLLKIMEENLVKQESSTILLHKIINPNDEYNLKQQTKINDRLDNFLNAIKRHEKWKTAKLSRKPHI